MSATQSCSERPSSPMATTYPAILRGGPCDGETKQVTANQLRTGRTFCKGALYLSLPTTPTKGYTATFGYAGAVSKSAVKGEVLHVTAAWTRWMRFLSHNGPTAHNRIKKATLRIRRIAR